MTCSGNDHDGATTCDVDCDDSNTLDGFNTHPGAEERCGSNRDDNCNRQTDEQPCCDASDADHDGVSEPPQLHALPARGVSVASLDYREAKRRARHGNLSLYRAKVGGAGGRAGRRAWDVFPVRGR